MLQTYGANKRGNVATYVVVCVLIATSGSLFAPVMSYYLNTELGFDPIHISIVFALLPLATIAIVQTIARFSDMGLQRPMIICIASMYLQLKLLSLFNRLHNHSKYHRRSSKMSHFSTTAITSYYTQFH